MPRELNLGRKIAILFVLAVTIVFCRHYNVEASEEASKEIIKFAEEKYTFAVSEKRSEEEIAEQFPMEIEVILKDGSSEMMEAKWECLDDFDSTDYDYYVYALVLPEAYILSEELTMWDMPIVEVVVEEEERPNHKVKWAANPSSSKYYNTYLGANKDIVSWLESHEDDSYYLGTRYVSVRSYMSKPIMCLRPNGEYKSMGYSSGGMNCTGFVASVMKKMGGKLSRIKSAGGAGRYANAYNWIYTMDKKNIKSYRYTSIKSMLASGNLQKGDLIYFEPDWSKRGVDCHIGFFWGDTSSDNKFWHSADGGNQISKIKSVSSYKYVYIFKTQKRGTLQIELRSAEPSVTDNNDKYDFEYAIYKLYNSKGDVVRTLTANEDGVAISKDIKVGTYTLKETSNCENYEENKKSYTVKVKNGKVTTTEIIKTPVYGSLELIAKSANTTVIDHKEACSLAGAIYKVYDINGEVVKEVTSDAEGKVSVIGLPIGSYVMKESESSKGFYKDKLEYEFQIISGETVVKSATKVPKIVYTKDETTHAKMCQECGAEKEENHIFKKGLCECGMTGICKHQWEEHLVQATKEADGIRTRTCTICEEKETVEVISRVVSVGLSETAFPYQAETEHTPMVQITDSKENALVQNVDYTVIYPAERIEIGTYIVTVVFQGKYSGTEELEFMITPEMVNEVSVKKYSSSKIKISWNEMEHVTGYQVSKSSKKDGVNICKTLTSTSLKIKAKKNQTYYYKVRAYKTVDGKKIYGPWSEVQSYKLK